MLYSDPLYWTVEITDPIALEIIASPDFQRLKGIDQAGYSEPFFPWGAHSRFEHSIGVYLLLKKFGASQEEQLAWLLHDISHGIFSHTLDYVFAEGSQENLNYQDSIFEKFIQKTSIPDILRKHDIDINYIIDDSNFPLKETNLPDLCADRIDYSLRGKLHYDHQDPRDLLDILDGLTAVDNKRVFKDYTSAKRFTDMFARMNDVYYSNLGTAIMFQTVADYLKHAKEKWYITYDDFYTTDAEVLAKIAPYHGQDEKLKLYRYRMNCTIKTTNNPDDYDVEVFCKSRVVDPLFMVDGEVKRISDVNEEWKEKLKTHSKAKKYFLKFEK